MASGAKLPQTACSVARPSMSAEFLAIDCQKLHRKRRFCFRSKIAAVRVTLQVGDSVRLSERLPFSPTLRECTKRTANDTSSCAIIELTLIQRER